MGELLFPTSVRVIVVWVRIKVHIAATPWNPVLRVIEGLYDLLAVVNPVCVSTLVHYMAGRY